MVKLKKVTEDLCYSVSMDSPISICSSPTEGILNNQLANIPASFLYITEPSCSLVSLWKKIKNKIDKTRLVSLSDIHLKDCVCDIDGLWVNEDDTYKIQEIGSKGKEQDTEILYFSNSFKYKIGHLSFRKRKDEIQIIGVNEVFYA